MCRRATALAPAPHWHLHRHQGPLCAAAPQQLCHTKAPCVQQRHSSSATPRPPVCRRATAALPHLGPLCESAPQRHCHTKAPYMQPRHGTGTHTALASAPPPRPPMCRRATALVSAPPPRHPMRRFSAVCHPMPVHIMQPCTTTPLLCGVPPYASAYNAALHHHAASLRCATLCRCI